jgi:lysophospholipase L1-like esterase
MAQARVLLPSVEKPLAGWLQQSSGNILGLALGKVSINKDRIAVQYGSPPRQCQLLLEDASRSGAPPSRVGDFAVSAQPSADPGQAACLQAFVRFAALVAPPQGLWTALAPAPLPKPVTSTTGGPGVHPDGELAPKPVVSLAPLDLAALAYLAVLLAVAAVVWRSPSWRKPVLLWGTVFVLAALLISPGYRPGSHETADRQMQFDSELGWAPTGDVIGTDAQGAPLAKALGIHHDQPDPTKPQLLVFGDSISEGWGLPVGDNFVSQARQLLPDWSVVNLSVSGYASEQEWQYFRRHSKLLRPKLVVLVYFIGNDLHGTRLENNYGTYKPQFRLKDGQLVQTNAGLGKFNCQTVLSRSTLMWPLWKAAASGLNDDRDRLAGWLDVVCRLERLSIAEAVDVQKEVLRQFRDDVAKAGGQLVVVISPTSVLMERGQEHPQPGLPSHQETYRHVQTTLSELGIPRWDWLQVLTGESPWCGSAGTTKHVCDQEKVFLDGGHYTKEASAWLGRWLATAAREAAKSGARDLP